MVLGKSVAPPLGAPAFRRKAQLFAQYMDTAFVLAGRPRLERATGVLRLSLPVPGGLAGRLVFSATAPALALGLAAARAPAAIVCQNAFDAIPVLVLRRLVRRSRRPRLVVEVHGSWRAMSRFYGGGFRKLIAPLADRAAAAAIRRADRIRVISAELEREVRGTGYEGEIDQFLTWSDFGLFLASPPKPAPARSRVLFVGALDRVKGIDVLLDAWPRVREAVGDAELALAGSGPRENDLRRQAGALRVAESVSFLGELGPERVRQELDESTCLVLPSRSEGLGRVLVESMARARPVVASRVGGITDLVDDGRNGLLVDPGSAEQLGAAIVRLLADRRTAEVMGAAGLQTAIDRDPVREYERGLARLSGWIVAQA